MMAVIRTQIQLTEAQAQRLRAEARARGVSMSEVVRDAVDRLPAEGVQDQRRRALSAVGAHGTGTGTGTGLVSERHDDHLAEAYGS